MADLSKKTIFITGISGFTGQHLESFYKEKNYTVFGTTYTTSKNPNHFPCDITEKEQIKEVLKNIQPDYIIHTAAISFVAGDNQNEMYGVNVFGTINLLEALIECEISPEKIIIASSAAVYGNIGNILSEDMCPQPINHYGNSKLAMENMVKNYFSKLNILIVRPFNYTGVGQTEIFLISKIIKHYKNKSSEIELGNINVFREFNDIDYLINCYYQLLLSNSKSEILNVCSSKTNSIEQILSYMEEITNYKIKTKINPKFVRKNEIKSLKGSTQKLHSIIDDFSNEYSLKKTLEKMYFS
ncbi:GDP-mannose 4,6-dehydratase [Aquimarina macrocephali]|uniref:GDP-mannose 4,6-dehydratase n=1 Tax=Aquimarina macrocephali TaxID=666563 RepID=UPI00046456BD|nr:GDP-mannose 4,6-dehydratase [Aquimarina macrocephali]